MGTLKDLSKMAGNIGKALTGSLKDKHSRAAAANRLRTVIRCEEKAAEKEYLALGRYYYNALRSSDNPITEAHCVRIDQIQARRDSALEHLEQAVRQQQAGSPAASMEIMDGEDGPTAVCMAAQVKPHKKGTLFHFDKGPIAITVTRDEDTEYDPEDENSEEIDLSDVERFDQDPLPEPPASGPAAQTEPGFRPAGPEFGPAKPEFGPAAPEFGPAELDENDGLPFES